MSEPTAQGYFSVPFDLVLENVALPYDIFINSSSVQGRQHWVRIVKTGASVASEDLGVFRKKYERIYVSESQRSAYLKSLLAFGADAEVERTEFLKTSAIRYLDTLFEKDLSTEVLNQTLTACRDVVENLVDSLQARDIGHLQSLIGKMSFHDFYTYDHSINVSMYCILIYRLLKPHASRSEIVQAGMGGLLHDLGKIEISTEILNCAGKLTDDQFDEIKKHPGLGRTILFDTEIHLPEGVDLLDLARTIHEHHENFDGSGYPRRLAGDDIHLIARITAIADFFDAVTTKRSYHEPLSTADAIDLMRKSAGKKIDPKIFEIFEKNTSHIALHAPLKVELAPDFDPCQPHHDLPLVAKTDAYGKIKLLDEDSQPKGSPRSKKSA